MHVKDLLDDLDIRVKLPQHWYSTDISNDFEDANLLENDEIIKIEAAGEKNTKLSRRQGHRCQVPEKQGRFRIYRKAFRIVLLTKIFKYLFRYNHKYIIGGINHG